jgi:hypothetical protein
VANFVVLDASQPEIARLIAAMAQARDSIGRRSWSHPHGRWRDILLSRAREGLRPMQA